MGKSLFWKGVLYGALAGGALSMIDRNTRQKAAECCKKTTSNISFYVKNPNEAVSQVKEVSAKIKTAYEQVSDDVAFIAETVEELREIAPQVAGMVQNTKEAFLPDSQNETGNDSNSSGSKEAQV